ncbi:hypothetical protein ACKFKF_18445 [Phormidesmis sp. 146-12]
MNTFSKIACPLVLVTVTALGVSQARSSLVSIRESNQSGSEQTLEKVGAIVTSKVTSSISLPSHSPFSFNAAFSPSPNPAPSGTGGAGSR